MRIQRIVVGTDFSDIAEHAVDEAVSMAKDVGASVVLVHAYELPMYSFPDGVVVSTPQLANDITSAGLKGLEASIAKRKASGVAIKTVLRMGPAWEEINAVAAEENADLIVVGTHGRRGLSRALL